MTSADMFPKGPLSMYLLIYPVRYLKTLEICHKWATPLIFPAGFQNAQKYFFGQAVSFNKFHRCLLDSTEGFRVYRGSLGHQQWNYYKRWSGLDSDNSCTPLCLFYSTSGVRALPVWPTCRSVGSWFQSRLHVPLSAPHLLCWHCGF